MIIDGKNSEANYYSGGLAELVTSPTILTYSFLQHWFTGSGSIGRAMEILGLPHSDINVPILELINGDLLINLSNEERILYSQTIFTYKKQGNTHETPKLIIDYRKIINPICLFHTVTLLFVQSKWIAYPNNSVAMAKKLLHAISEDVREKNITQTDVLLREKIWPVVVVIGMLSEFYSQLLIKEAGKNIQKINEYISYQIVKEDWFFRSFADLAEVKKTTLSFSDYIKKYGIRSDKDYELTSPRWHEIPETIKKRIREVGVKDHKQEVSLEVEKKLQQIINTCIQLQIMRSEAKRVALVFIDHLRKEIVEKTKGLSDISELTREEIITNQLPKFVQQNKNSPKQKKENLLNIVLAGKGIPVSQGNVTGVAKHITNTSESIPSGTIGIFPNASPEFAIQYPKCIGMIFLKGGQTSHGAIVAREFKIPALIDHEAKGIKDGTRLEIHGAIGAWQIQK